jgi:hypothetical protein
VLYSSGLSLLASGLFHIGVFISQRSPWSGPLSWRKPILFGVSGGVTALSAGWAAGLVADTAIETREQTRRWERRFDLLFALGILCEVGLITAQTWKGKLSHLNSESKADVAVGAAIDALILMLTALSINLTVRSMRPVLSGLRPKDEVLALRLGLGLFLVGCALGIWTLAHGRSKSLLGLNPGLWGTEGVLNFPQGLPLHALQVLPLQSWALGYLEMKEESRIKFIAGSAAGFLLITGFGVSQTVRGRARFACGPVSGMVLALGVGLIAAPLLAAGSVLFGWGRGIWTR